MFLRLHTCSICLESDFINSDTHDKRKFFTKCNHVYHYDCIYKWAQVNNSCPTCRTNNMFDEFNYFAFSATIVVHQENKTVVYAYSQTYENIIA